MPFQITPLSSTLFTHLYGKTDTELEKLGAKAYIAKQNPGFPCRVSLRDAEPGERLMLLNFTHQACNTPYRSSHAIFVIDGAIEAKLDVNEIPASLSTRLLSIRGFDSTDMMIASDVAEGHLASSYIKEIFNNKNIHYLHIHNAKPGCYAACANRIAQ